MNAQNKTLWELQPESIVIPGASQEPPTDIVFTKDPAMPGLYRVPVIRERFEENPDHVNLKIG